jgi:hydrogenase nickel incorporation protein HypA/HybF
MHELAITQSVIDAIVDHTGEARVRRVSLEIGALSGVLAESVRFCFDLVARGTTLEGARLVIMQPPGRARCRDCEREFGVDDLIPLCPCGSADVELLTGQQVRIASVEVS